jgi:sarcosine oxidase subunit beta
MSYTSDVLIIGGGLHGCSAALHLVMRGQSVTVLERDASGRHASGLSAGGVRRLGRHLAEVPLSIRATEYWQDIQALVDDDCGYRQSRYLQLAENDADLETGHARAAEMRANGFVHEAMIDEAALRAFVPGVASHCVGALHVDGDGAADPLRTTLAFKRRAEALGAVFFDGAAVTAISRIGDGWRVESSAGAFEGGALVNAAGAWGGKVAAMLGEAPPVEARAPMMQLTEPVAPFADAVFGALGDALSLKQMENGAVMIGGGRLGRALPDQGVVELVEEGLARSLATARRLFPILEAAKVERRWAGIEGYMPDDIPVLSIGAEKSIVHSFGYSAHGFQLGPAAGEVVADLVMHGETKYPIEAFRIDRF